MAEPKQDVLPLEEVAFSGGDEPIRPEVVKVEGPRSDSRVLNPEMKLLIWLRQRPALRSFIAIRAIDELNSQMLNVAIGWYVYSVTHHPMSLAYIGLARFLPNVALVLVAGPAADRF